MAKAAKVQEKLYMIVVNKDYVHQANLTEEELVDCLENLLEDYHEHDIEIFLDSPLPFKMEKKFTLKWK